MNSFLEWKRRKWRCVGISSSRWQRTLDGYCLTLEQRIDFIKKVTKFKKYYKTCLKCDKPVVNKPNRYYCVEHYREFLRENKPFSEPLLLVLLLDLEAGE